MMMMPMTRGCFSLNSLMIGSVAVATIMAMGVVDVVTVTGWVLPPVVTTTIKTTTAGAGTAERKSMNHRQLPLQPQLQLQSQSPHRRSRLFMAAEEEVAEETASSSSSSSLSFLDDDEWKIVEDMHAKASKKATDSEDSDQKEAFQNAAEELLPSLSAALIMKLRNGEELIPSDDDDDSNSNSDNADHAVNIFLELSKALNGMMDRRLESARDTLAQLMNAGEIKKLDALIGNSARNQKLDVAFFQVLQMNLRDAGEEAQQATATAEGVEGTTDAAVNRFQILQHIYTRCQEEVEKTINPGTALLNKLLRTEVDSIRSNQLNHYLCPAPTTIKSPDGKEITLNNGQPSKSLVSHPDFCDAIGNAVTQIRTVEKSGAANAAVAADLVESIRQVAKEARMVVGEHFGGNSTEVLQFEEALEPVFRPTSPDSPYIQGE